MKGSLVMILCFLSSVVLAQNKQFRISGKMAKVENGSRLYLSYRDANGSNIKDSAILKRKKFRFKGVVNSPTYAKITMMHKGNRSEVKDELGIYLDKGKLKVRGEEFIRNAKTKGIAINNEFQKYYDFISSPDSKVEAMQKRLRAASEEERKEMAYERIHTIRMARMEKQELQNKFIKENPNSYFSLVALSEVAGRDIDLAEIQPVYMSFSEEIRNTELGRNFKNKLEEASMTAIGAIAPDFSQNDVNGKPVKLSDFRGKYVLLDFWASWCGPCRVESPNLVKNFEKYKDKNFTILGVSLDNPGKKQNWLDAIEKDKLHWNNVSDLKGWQNEVAQLYGVYAVPRSYLIDPDGKIIAINPRGGELSRVLEKILGE